MPEKETPPIHSSEPHFPPLPDESPSLDDTQPRPPLSAIPDLDDTQPHPALKADFRRLPLSRALVLLAGSAAFLLFLTVGLALFTVLSADEDAAPVRVTIQDDTRSYTVTTEAQTVGELMREQAIVLEDGDRISVPVAEALQPDMTLLVERANTVALTIDDQTRVLRTHMERPADVLRDAGVTVDAGDRVFLDGAQVSLDALETIDEPAFNIVIRRGIDVRIIDGDQVIELDSRGQTVGDALYEANVTLFLADSISPEISAPLVSGMDIIVIRSRPLTIVADGERIETRTGAATVGQALAEANITLSGLDYAIPALDVEVVPNSTVRVIRVLEELLAEQEITEYETLYQADSNLQLDARQVLQAGQNGVVERSVRVRYENGIEVQRTVESETQVQEVRDQIISYGTNIVIRTLNTPEGPVEYWRKLRVYATSYHPAALGGDDVTSIGFKLRKGVIGIDPRIIPYRTNMYVEGYGTGVAADTGAPRRNPYWIDLGYSDEDFEGWHWWVDVYLLTPVPENVNYLLPVTSRGGPVP